MNKNILEEAELGRHKCQCGSLVFHLGSLAVKKHPDREELKQFAQIAVCANKDCREIYLYHESIKNWAELSDSMKHYVSEEIMVYLIQPDTLDFAELREHRNYNSILDQMVTS